MDSYGCTTEYRIKLRIVYVYPSRYPAVLLACRVRNIINTYGAAIKDDGCNATIDSVARAGIPTG
jgi:hypothetical protein